MDLPVPEGQVKEKSFASHSTMSKSFGLQRKTLVRVIGLENRVGKLESNVAGISIEKFTEINQTIKAVNDNLQSIGGLLDNEGRQKFDEYLRSIAGTEGVMPSPRIEGDTIFEYFVDDGMEWDRWLAPAWDYPESNGIYSLLNHKCFDQQIDVKL